jgi:hypothetical protein
MVRFLHIHFAQEKHNPASCLGSVQKCLFMHTAPKRELALPSVEEGVSPIGPVNMCENNYGVCFGGPWRPHWETRGITYGPGETFAPGLSADNEWRAYVRAELDEWAAEIKRHIAVRREESRHLFSLGR